ncbi:MAG: GGDEF domain-containing protein, partial [Phycisphaerales bacterium]
AGIPIMVGPKLVGTLVCQDQAWAMGDGHAMLVERADWLSAWIKLEVQQAQLRQGAFTDALTGAWNRRYFSRYLDAAIVESRSARQPLTVMLFDIDGFKHYNDTYGHGAGDEILIETVKLLKSVIRPSDRVCRVGGDEFAVIFYEPQGPRDPESKPLESVYQIARRFQQQICTHRFPKLGAEAMGTLTVSGGLASYPWDGHDAESLLEQADQLAMASKRNGKNAITLGPGAESVCKCPPMNDD